MRRSAYPRYAWPSVWSAGSPAGHRSCQSKTNGKPARSSCARATSCSVAWIRFPSAIRIEQFSRRFLVPYIDIGMDVHEAGNRFVIGGQVALSTPGEHCLWCMGILDTKSIADEARRYGAAGGRPQVVWPNGVLASIAVGLFAQLLAGLHDDIEQPLDGAEMFRSCTD
jgi:hypothetical protein